MRGKQSRAQEGMKREKGRRGCQTCGTGDRGNIRRRDKPIKLAKEGKQEKLKEGGKKVEGIEMKVKQKGHERNREEGMERGRQRKWQKNVKKREKRGRKEY